MGSVIQPNEVASGPHREAEQFFEKYFRLAPSFFVGDGVGAVTDLLRDARAMDSAVRIGWEDAVQRVVEADRQDRWQTRAAFAYPALVCLLAALGIWWLGRSGFPHEGLIVSPAGPAVADRTIPTGRFLRSIGWPAAGGCVALAAAAAAWWRTRNRPRQSGRHEALACEVRAAATSAGLSSADEERIVGEICGAVATRRAAVSGPPPLAALAGSLPDPLERAEALRATADFYWLLDERCRRRRRWLLPICGILAAGFLVLLYGVAMFGPLAEFMNAIATRPPVGPGSGTP
jgi:hypothetical protein